MTSATKEAALVEWFFCLGQLHPALGPNDEADSVKFETTISPYYTRLISIIQASFPGEEQRVKAQKENHRLIWVRRPRQQGVIERRFQRLIDEMETASTGEKSKLDSVINRLSTWVFCIPQSTTDQHSSRSAEGAQTLINKNCDVTVEEIMTTQIKRIIDRLGDSLKQPYRTFLEHFVDRFYPSLAVQMSSDGPEKGTAITTLDAFQSITEEMIGCAEYSDYEEMREVAQRLLTLVDLQEKDATDFSQRVNALPTKDSETTPTVPHGFEMGGPNPNPNPEVEAVLKEEWNIPLQQAWRAELEIGNAAFQSKINAFLAEHSSFMEHHCRLVEKFADRFPSVVGFGDRIATRYRSTDDEGRVAVNQCLDNLIELCSLCGAIPEEELRPTARVMQRIADLVLFVDRGSGAAFS